MTQIQSGNVKLTLTTNTGVFVLKAPALRITEFRNDFTHLPYVVKTILHAFYITMN